MNIPRLQRFFDDQRFFWDWFTPLLAAIAVLRGMHEPIPFALTQASLDYRFGFIKRGLHGAVLSHFDLVHRNALDAVAICEFCCFITATIVFCKTRRVRDCFGDLSVVAVFVSSYAVTYLANLIGYLDVVGFTICLSLLSIKRPKTRLIVSIPTVFLALLVHEAFAILCLPVLIFSFFIDGLSGNVAEKVSRNYIGLLLGLSVLVVVTAGRLSLHSNTATRVLITDLRARADFPLQEDAISTLARSLRGDAAIMLHKFCHSPRWWWTMVESSFTLGPVVLFFLYILRRSIDARRRSFPKQSKSRLQAMTRASVLVVLAPMSMHFVAWDNFRWNAFGVLNLFLVVAVVADALDIRLILASWEKRLIFFVIAISLASGYALLDGYKINPYPFYPRIFPMLD